MVHGRTDLIKTSYGRLSDERCPLGSKGNFEKPGKMKSGKVVQLSSQIGIIEQSKNNDLKEVSRYPLGLARWSIA